ncbi:GDSL-type esterase/lipase family protein [Virgibacillus sp. LDC1]|nr:GDSL-type esterase/lipase family protein [Virgibacillus sp. LDC1]
MDLGKVALSMANQARVKYLWGTGLNKWLYAVSYAKREGKQLNIVCATDSLSAGAGGTGPIDFFRPKILQVLGDGGVGFIAANNSAVVAEGGSLGASGATQKTNATFDPSTDDKYSPNLYSMVFTGTGGYANISDKNHVFTKAKVLYLQQPGGGTFKWGDAAFAAGRMDINTDGTKEVKFVEHTGTFPTQFGNTVQVGSVTGPVQVMGVDLRNGASGARVHRLAQGGTQTRQVAQLDGSMYTTVLKSIGCDLYILNTGMNDSGTSAIPAETVDADIRTILGWVRAANPNTAILLVMPNETADSNRNNLLETYRLKILKIALDYDALIFDTRWVIGNYSQAQANGLMNDSIHPHPTKANPLIGEALFNFIGGSNLANIEKMLS